MASAPGECEPIGGLRLLPERSRAKLMTLKILESKFCLKIILIKKIVVILNSEKNAK
jgi:hypothetical protein